MLNDYCVDRGATESEGIFMKEITEITFNFIDGKCLVFSNGDCKCGHMLIEEVQMMNLKCWCKNDNPYITLKVKGDHDDNYEYTLNKQNITYIKIYKYENS